MAAVFLDASSGAPGARTRRKQPEMARAEPLPPERPGANGTAWRKRAVSRSLNAARSRAEDGSSGFSTPSFALIDEKGTTEFTIQEVLDRANQSLRRFYEYFDGKDELVLALFEETVREAGDDIRKAVDAETDPLARLRTFTIRLHEWCDPVETPRKRGSHNRRAISEFSMHLEAEHAERVRAVVGSALAPAARPHRRADEAARSASATLAARAALRAADRSLQLVRQPPGREPEAAAHAEETWEFCLHGLSR